MEIVLTIVSLIILLIIYIYYKQIRYFDNKKIPSLVPTLLFGNFGPIIFKGRSVVDQGKVIYESCPTAKYVGFHALLKPIIMLRDIELIKWLTIKHFQKFPNHSSPVDENLDPLIGKGMIFLKNQSWKTARSVFCHMFSSANVNRNFKMCSDCAINFAEYNMTVSGSKANEVEMKEMFSRYIIDVAVQIFYGMRVDSVNDPVNIFTEFIRRAAVFDNFTKFKMLIFRFAPLFSRLLRIHCLNQERRELITKNVTDIINAKADILGNDAIALMLRAQKNGIAEFGNVEVISQAFLLFVGSVESISAALSFATYELAQNSDIQDKLRAEIDEALNSNKEISYDVIQNMTYLDAVVNELLRKYPPVSHTDRECSVDTELPPALPNLDPYTVKAGSVLWIPIYAIHHDPQYFPNPEKFDPDRFYNTDLAKESRGFFTFGIGPRKCLGTKLVMMKMKTVLFHLLARCELTTSIKTPFINLTDGIFSIEAKGGVWIRIKKRQ